MARATGTNKTEPAAKDDASKNVFAKEFLVQVFDPSDIPAELIESNKVAVRVEAEQRGLRATGEAELKSREPQDARNVLLTYTLPVEPADEAK